MQFKSLLLLFVIAFSALSFDCVTESRLKRFGFLVGNDAASETNKAQDNQQYQKDVKPSFSMFEFHLLKPSRLMFLKHRKQYTISPDEPLQSPISSQEFQQIVQAGEPSANQTETGVTPTPLEQELNTAKSKMKNLKKEVAEITRLVKEKEPSHSQEVRELEHKKGMDQLSAARVSVQAQIDSLEKDKQALLEGVARFNAARAESEEKRKLVATEEATAGEKAKASESEEATAGEKAKASESEEATTGEKAKASESEEGTAGEKAKASESEEGTAGEKAKASESEEATAGEKAKASESEKATAGEKAKASESSEQEVATPSEGSEKEVSKTEIAPSEGSEKEVSKNEIEPSESSKQPVAEDETKSE